MAQKVFGREEADRMLPLVSDIVRDIRTQYRLYTTRRRALARLQRRNMMDPEPGLTLRIDELERDLEGCSRDLKGFIRELTELHVLIKDPHTGIVDFPSRMKGEDAFLCWKFGEKRVEHWHGIEEGFAGRKRLSRIPSSA